MTKFCAQGLLSIYQTHQRDSAPLPRPVPTIAVSCLGHCAERVWPEGCSAPVTVPGVGGKVVSETSCPRVRASRPRAPGTIARFSARTVMAMVTARSPFPNADACSLMQSPSLACFEQNFPNLLTVVGSSQHHLVAVKEGDHAVVPERALLWKLKVPLETRAAARVARSAKEGSEINPSSGSCYTRDVAPQGSPPGRQRMGKAWPWGSGTPLPQ